MSLLDKACQGALLLAWLFSLVACGDSDTLLELESGNSETEVLFQNFDLDVSTIYIDSLRTDGGTQLLFGANRDSVYGLVDVTGYAELNYRNGAIPADTLEVNRGTFYFRVGEILSSGILVDQTVEFRLTREPIYESAIYQSNETLVTDEEVIGTIPLLLGSGDTLLSIDFSSEFVNAFWDNLKESNNIADLDFGLALSGRDENGGIASIDITADSTFIELTSNNAVDSSFVTVFLLENQFHNIERDRSGSVLSSLSQTGDNILNGDYAYVNGLAGVYTKIDLIPLTEFIENNSDVVINIASLEIPLPNNRVNNLSERIDGLNFFFGNDIGIINGSGTISDLPNTVLAPEIEYSQRIVTSRNVTLNEEDTLNYNQSISLFAQYMLEQRLAGENFVTNEFILIPSSRLTLEQSVILGNQVNLDLFYTVLRN